MSAGNLSLSQAYDLDGTLDSLFALEPDLIDRIRAEIPGLKTVDSSSLIADSEDFTHLLPAAFIEPGSGARNIDGEGYDIGNIKQRWAVLIVVRHFATVPGEGSAAQTAGPFALQIIAALRGWTPSDYIEPLIFTGHADPVSGAGWAAFELTFETELTL